MSTSNIGAQDDLPAIGSGSVISQLKRIRLPSQVQYDLPPMWGASRLRNEVSKNDASGSVEVTEDTGELRLSTGGNGNDRIELRSAQYAQYRSGLWGEAAFGIRMTKKPSGDQVARWGYYDDNAGFGWGIDSISIFTFYREAGSDTVYRPPEYAESDALAWNLDPLNGSGESGLTHDISYAAAFPTLFRLSGHGPVFQYVEAKDPDRQYTPEVAVDRRVYPTEINLVDFNRQLRAEIDNGGTDQDLDLYVAGRQYSLWGDQGVFERRQVPTLVRNYNVSSIHTWEPIIAARKQPNFPPSESRGNSVSAQVVNIEGNADGAAEVKLTFDANVTNESDFSAPDEWSAEEAAVETITVDDTPPQVDGTQEGLRVGHVFIPVSRSNTQTIQKRSQLPLGTATEAVLWARASSTSTDINASLTIEEQW